MKVRQIGDWALQDRLAAGGPPVVVLFHQAEGRQDAPLRGEFRRVAADHPEAVFVELDLIENPSAVRAYGLTGSPVVVVFVDGLEVGRHVGRFLAAAITRVLGPCPQEGEET